MAKSSKSGEKQSGNGRNNKGQWAKGNDEGTQWTDKDGDNPCPKGGRPPTKKMTDALLKHLDKMAIEFEFAEKAAKKMGMDPETSTCFEVLMASTILHGMRGRGDFLKTMWDRVEGTVAKHMSFGVDDPVQKYIDHMLGMTAPEPPPDDEEKDKKK